MADLTFTNPQGQDLTVTSPDGSVPSEQELDTMFSQKYGSAQQTQKQPEQSQEQDQDEFSGLGQKAQAQPKPQQKAPLNFSDMLKMAALNSPQEQQDYLKSKFRFAESNQDGSFNVGNDPTNLSPIHPGNIGDAALNVLAKGAAMIPAIAGQMRGAITGAEMGTAIEPGVGTVLGGLIGAGSGAMAGEGAKNLANAQTPGYDPQKAAADNVISGLFGAGGQALGSAIKFGAKNFIAPKIAAAMDGAIQSGDDPSKGAVFLSKVLKFTANVDPKESMIGSKLGWKNIYSNPANLNSDEIDNIAQDVSQSYLQKEGIAKSALNASEESFVSKNPNAQIDAKGILNNVVSKLSNASILDTFEGDEANGVPASFSFKAGLPNTVKSSDVVNFMKSLGATESRGGTEGQFMVPLENNITLKDAINAKKIWGHTIVNKEFNPTVGNVFKTAIFGEGPSPLYPNGFNGLRSAINDSALNMAKNGAENSPGESYLLANSNFSKLMDAKDGILVNGGNKSVLPGWMDVTNPSSVAKYLRNVNKLDAFNNHALSNLHNQIGGDFKDRASKWAVAQAMGKASPQILRLGVVGGLLGLAMPGSPADRAARVPMAFALGSPTGVKVMARMAESGGELGTVGNKMLASMAQSTITPTGRAVISQLLSKKVRR